MKTIESITLMGPNPKLSSNKTCKPYIDIISVRDNKRFKKKNHSRIYSGKDIHSDKEYTCKVTEYVLKVVQPYLFVYGDILIKLYHVGITLFLNMR